MIKILPRNILRFIILVLLQVLVLNNIQISGYLNPYFYVLFILLLPFETPKWALLIIAFILGLSIDLFEYTLGIHASASVFMAFLRPYILALFAPREGYETGSFPRIHFYGFTWFLKYSAILVFGHHLFLFYFQVFRFTDFFITFSRVCLSTIFTVFLIMVSQYLFFRK